MSSRTPQECIDRALDESADGETRSAAIHELKTANECDELEALVRRESLDEQYRRQALEALATPQCDSTLRELVEEDPIGGSLQDDAAALLETVEGN